MGRSIATQPRRQRYGLDYRLTFKVLPAELPA
jgi:hypothetical protein